MSSREEAANGYRGVRRTVVNGVENLGDDAFAYLLLTPAFLALTAMAVWPLASTFEMSLRADDIVGTGTGAYIGLTNYVEILTGQRDARMPRPFFELSRPFQSALLVTILFTLVSVFLEALLGFGQALLLDKDFRGRRWVRVAILIPWAVPIAIQGMIFYLMFIPGIGFATDLFHSLGLFSSTPLVNSGEAFFIVVLADVWKTAPFIALIVLAGLQSIDRRLYDVAKVSGATPWQRFKLVTFPLVLPALLVALLFRTLGAMKVFGLIETIASCSAVPSLSCMVVMAFNAGRYGTSAAIAFIMAVIIGAVLLAYILKFAQTQST